MEYNNQAVLEITTQEARRVFDIERKIMVKDPEHRDLNVVNDDYNSLEGLIEYYAEHGCNIDSDYVLVITDTGKGLTFECHTNAEVQERINEAFREMESHERNLDELRSWGRQITGRG